MVIRIILFFILTNIHCYTFSQGFEFVNFEKSDSVFINFDEMEINENYSFGIQISIPSLVFKKVKFEPIFNVELINQVLSVDMISGWHIMSKQKFYKNRNDFLDVFYNSNDFPVDSFYICNYYFSSFYNSYLLKRTTKDSAGYLNITRIYFINAIGNKLISLASVASYGIVEASISQSYSVLIGECDFLQFSETEMGDLIFPEEEYSNYYEWSDVVFLNLSKSTGYFRSKKAIIKY